MTLRLSAQRLLAPNDLTPFRPGFEVIGVFNPGAVLTRDGVVLVARVAERPNELKPGLVGLPRHMPNGELTVDWTTEGQLDQSDPRVVRQRTDDRVRLTSVSHLRVFRRASEAVSGWEAGSALLPELPSEEYGVEDPRITEIEGRYWITYVAVSRHGVTTALASTKDVESFERHGVIFPPENKDAVFFPRKIHGRYVSLHRRTANTDFCRPGIWLARSPDLLHWGNHEPLLSGVAEWVGTGGVS